MQKSKMAVCGGLKIAVKEEKQKSKGKKERYKHLNAEFQRLAGRERKLPSEISAKNRGKEQNGKD